MVDFSQYGTADYANQVANKLSGFNLPENIAARRAVQIGQQAEEVKLKQLQQDVQDKELAQQAWKSAVEQGRATGESPIAIYRKNAANLGYAQAAEAEKYQQEQAKLNAPKYEFDKATGQLIGITPTGTATVSKVEGYQPSMKLEGASNLRKLIEERNQYQPGTKEYEAYTNAIRKESETTQQISPRFVMPRQERMVAVIDPVTNIPMYVPQSEARGMRPATGAAASADKAIYDTASNEWVYPPSAEFPQGRRTGDVGKQNALSAAVTLINEFKGTEDKPGPIYTTPTGGILGLTGQLSKVTDTQKVKDFNNLRESLSTQLRAIMRIPGEGALSDKEQAQYGLQLPDIGNDPEVNARILDRIQTTMGMRASSVPVEPKALPQSVKPMVSMPPASSATGRIVKDTNTGIRYKSDGARWVRVQ